MLDEMQTTFSCQRYDPRLTWKCSPQPLAMTLGTGIGCAVVPEIRRRISNGSRVNSSIGYKSLAWSDGIDNTSLCHASTAASFTTSAKSTLKINGFGSKENASEHTIIESRHSVVDGLTLASPYRSISLMMEEIMDNVSGHGDVSGAKSFTIRNASLVPGIPHQTQPSSQFLIDDSIVDIQTVPRWEEIREENQNMRGRRHSGQDSVSTTAGMPPPLSSRWQTALHKEKRVWWKQDPSASYMCTDQSAQDGPSAKREPSATSIPDEGVVQRISLAEAKLKPLPDLPSIDSHSARDMRNWQKSLLYLFPCIPSSRKAVPSEANCTPDSSSQHPLMEGVASFLARCFGGINVKASETYSKDLVNKQQEGSQAMIAKEVKTAAQEK